jgi:hypothetical protein
LKRESGTKKDWILFKQLPSILLFQFTALLRASNVQQLRDLVDDNAQWSMIVARSKAVFDSVKESIPEWFADQRRLSEIEQLGPTHRPRFSRTEEVRGPTSTNPTRKGKWDQYLELIVSAQNDADLKQWWNLYRREFPVCYSLEQACLCVPATSAGLERIFSKDAVYFHDSDCKWTRTTPKNLFFFEKIKR